MAGFAFLEFETLAVSEARPFCATRGVEGPKLTSWSPLVGC